MTLRVWIASLLLRLTRIISPFQGQIDRVWLFGCPHCGARFFDIPGSTVLCPKCAHQFFVQSDQEKAWIVEEPQLCDYACGWTEPYGFVPEAGCPVHDRGG